MRKKFFFLSISVSFLFLVLTGICIYYRYTNQYVFLLWATSIFVLYKNLGFKSSKNNIRDFFYLFYSKSFLLVSVIYFSFRIHYLSYAKILKQHHDSTILAYNAHLLFSNFLDTGRLDILADAAGPITRWPAAWFYIQGFITHILGFNVYTTRILGILNGFLILCCLWFIGIKFFKSRILAFSSCFIYAGLFPAIYFANASINNLPCSLFFILSLIFIILAEKYDEKLYLIVGLTIGLALYFYLSAMLLPFIVVSFLLFYLLVNKIRGFKIFIKKVFFLMVGYTFSSLPYWVFSLKYNNFLISRTGCVNISNNVQGFYDFFIAQLKIMINSFYLGYFNGGLFFVDISFFNSIFLSVLFFIGFIFCLFLFKRKEVFVFVIYFLANFIAGGIFTDATPAAPRLLSLFWSASFFVGFAISIFYRLLDKIFTKINLHYLNTITVAIFFLYILCLNVKTYQKGFNLAKKSIYPEVGFIPIYEKKKLPVYGFVPPHTQFLLSVYLGDFNFKILDGNKLKNENINNNHYLLVYFDSNDMVNDIITKYRNIKTLGNGEYNVYEPIE